MDISSIDMTLARMQNIEKQFAQLSTVGVPKSEQSFQEILDNDLTRENFDEIGQVINDDKEASKPQIDSLIEKYSGQNNLDKDFVKALIKQESGFQPKVTSKCGAMGLMQLMPSTAKGLGVDNAYNAEQNIMGGTKYLKNLLNQYGGNKELALAAYNAGPNAVKKYNGIPPYQETQNYVKNVISNYERYKKGGV